MAEGEDSDVSPASRPPGPGSVRNPRPLRVARVPHRRCSALLGACIAALAAHSWAGFFGSNRASSSARFGGPGRRPDGSGGPFGARAMARPWPYCHAGPGPLPPDPSHVHNRGPPARAGLAFFLAARARRRHPSRHSAPAQVPRVLDSERLVAALSSPVYPGRPGRPGRPPCNPPARPCQSRLIGVDFTQRKPEVRGHAPAGQRAGPSQAIVGPKRWRPPSQLGPPRADRDRNRDRDLPTSAPQPADFPVQNFQLILRRAVAPDCLFVSARLRPGWQPALRLTQHQDGREAGGQPERSH